MVQMFPSKPLGRIVYGLWSSPANVFSIRYITRNNVIYLYISPTNSKHGFTVHSPFCKTIIKKNVKFQISEWNCLTLISWATNYSLILVRVIPALIYNFTCEITKLLWQRAYSSVPRWRPDLKMSWMKILRQ